MLIRYKVRDDIDLKELEKFGFEYSEDDGFLGRSICPHYTRSYKYYRSTDIDCLSRCISRRSEDYTYSEDIFLSDIYDLIQANLIETIVK